MSDYGDDRESAGDVCATILLLGFVAILLFIWILDISSRAHAAEAPELCTDISVPKKAIEAHNGKWIALTPEQWQFLRGIYAMNPLTPPGLPYGDKAALAKVDGDSGGLIFFIDGDKACTPMPVPDKLLAMMDDVATGKISHQGDGL